VAAARLAGGQGLRGVWPRGTAAWRRLRRLARRHRQFPAVNAPHAFVNALQDSLALAVVLALAGPAAAGLFGLTVRVVMAPTSLIGGALSEVLLGRAAQAVREGGPLAPLVRRAAGVLALCALPVAGGLMLAGPDLFVLAFGPDWRQAGEWARWLAPCMAGRLVVGPLTVLPMLLDRQPTAMAFSVVGNVLYVLALAATLAAGGGMVLASAAISVVMGLYFTAYLGWLLRLAQAPRRRPETRA
jgi:O-antigen/teichoic acid export membrane protein